MHLSYVRSAKEVTSLSAGNTRRLPPPPPPPPPPSPPPPQPSIGKSVVSTPLSSPHDTGEGEEEEDIIRRPPPPSPPPSPLNEASSLHLLHPSPPPGVFLPRPGFSPPSLPSLRRPHFVIRRRRPRNLRDRFMRRLRRAFFI